MSIVREYEEQQKQKRKDEANKRKQVELKRSTLKRCKEIKCRWLKNNYCLKRNIKIKKYSNFTCRWEQMKR